jgi:DNA repair exonuclease SbcCD nuclease subunit
MHLHERKEFNRMEGEIGSRLLEGINILNQIADVVKHRGIKSVVCLGDIFELKDRVPNHIQIAFGEALHAIDAHVYILLGNHDFKIKKYSTLKVMELGDMITLIDRPRMLLIEGQKIGFIPYYRDFDDFSKAWERLHTTHVMDMVCFHQFIPGISYKSGHKVPGTFSLELQYGTRYLSGHLHLPCTVLENKIQYLGSPYQVNFGEGGDDKFIWLYNPDTRTLGSMKMVYPEFKTIDIFNELDKDKISGNYIKLVGNLTPDQRNVVAETKSKYLKMGARGVTTNITYMREIKKRLVTSESTPQNVISEFVGGMSKALTVHLDKSRLISIGESLLQEAKSG